MGFKFVKVEVKVELINEFAGRSEFTFEWCPESDDLLAKALLAKNRELIDAEVKREIAAGNLPNPMILM